MNEIYWSDVTGRQEYAIIRDRIGRVWNSSGAGAFVTYDSTFFSSYTVAAAEQGTASAFYAASMPTAIPAGIYGVVGKRQIGGSAAETDPTVAQGDINWGGTATVPLSDLATSGQIGQIAPLRLAKGVQVLNFPFKLVSSVDHVTPFTSGVVSGSISRDGGAFGPLQSGAFTELGKGWYSLQALTSGDMNAGSVALVMTANGVSGGSADQRDFGFLTQKNASGL